MSISVFVVVMMPSAGEKIVHGMVTRGWTVKPIPRRVSVENNDLVETHPDSFSSIVQFHLDNDPSPEQVEMAHDDVNEILKENDIKFYAMFVMESSVSNWSLGNLRKPSNVIPFSPYRS